MANSLILLSNEIRVSITHVMTRTKWYKIIASQPEIEEPHSEAFARWPIIARCNWIACHWRKIIIIVHGRFICFLNRTTIPELGRYCRMRGPNTKLKNVRGKKINHYQRLIWGAGKKIHDIAFFASDAACNPWLSKWYNTGATGKRSVQNVSSGIEHPIMSGAPNQWYIAPNSLA